MKQKPSKQTSISGDFKPKSMILPLEPSLHAQIKAMADKIDLAQPKVVHLILQRAISSAEDYISEIKKERATEQLKDLENKQRELDHEKQRLKNLLAE